MLRGLPQIQQAHDHQGAGKGRNLVNLPADAKQILDDLHGTGSTAGYAVHFVASFEGVMMVLSGMSNMEQMQDNLAS